MRLPTSTPALLVTYSISVQHSQVDVFNLEVDTNRRDERLRERIVRIAQQEACLPHACSPQQARPMNNNKRCTRRGGQWERAGSAQREYRRVVTTR